VAVTGRRAKVAVAAAVAAGANATAGIDL